MCGRDTGPDKQTSEMESANVTESGNKVDGNSQLSIQVPNELQVLL